ncbi:hypothetical protein KUTeg_010909 [Tegillarca granosa]|uniref:Iron-responsive element-binding protein 1 n=1 Tax=Tegillarca granosa TaxID=220873 RepID=A0ABQ9F2C0_TEGGR|nr:hypothetical protein KUTeg_010909 [Tegillarca granosa]
MADKGGANPYVDIQTKLEAVGKEYTYFSLPGLNDSRLDKLPYSIRILLESAVRNCDGFQVLKKDVENILNWQENQSKSVEIPFKPARVILQDFTGVPAVVDFAAMRDAIKRLGGNPEKINPICPADLVIDHSIQVDVARSLLKYSPNPGGGQGSCQSSAQTSKPSSCSMCSNSRLPVLDKICPFHKLKTHGADSLEQNQELEFERNKERFVFLKWGADALKNMFIVPPGSGIVHQVNLEYLARVVFDTDKVLYPDSVVGTDSHTTMINGLGVVGWGVGGIEAEAVMLGQSISMVLPEVVGYKLTGKLDPLTTSTDIVLTITKHLRQIGVVGKFVEFFGPGVEQLSIADRATISNMCPEYGATVGFFPVDSKSLHYLRQTGRNEDKIKLIETYLQANKMFRDYSNAGQDPQFSQAVEAGLNVKPYIKTSLSPGSGVVTYYLRESGVTPYMEKLGFDIVGYGCMTCIGNSGPLPESVSEAIEKGDLVACGVLSGNRNFEGRIHPLTRANYLASPPLVIAYALAGTVCIDFEKEPLGNNQDGKPVYLRDIWPTREEIQTKELPKIGNVSDAYVLLNLGDSVTTDHISPAGSIARNSPAARYLGERGLTPREFNSYGSRRGNDAVMSRGTFANIRLVNKFMSKPGARTVYLPTGDEMDIFDAAQRYKSEGKQVIVLAGKEYGSGSSRDWAAKGPWILGIKAVIAESYERIHRSNLVGMGIIPLQYLDGQTATSLGLTGKETYTIEVPENLQAGQIVNVKMNDERSFQVKARFDTDVELTYFRQGGILNYMIRQML